MSARFLVLLVALVVTPALVAQGPVVVVTDAADMSTSVREAKALAAEGMTVAVIAAPGCYIGRAEGPALQALKARSDRHVLDVTSTAIDKERIPLAKRIGTAYLERLLAGDFDTKPGDPVMDWSGHPDHDLLREGSGRATEGEAGEGTGTLRLGGGTEAADWTCGENANSEFMWGVVLASTFFLESNGAIDPDTYTWTQAHIDDVKLQVIDAWSIWSYTAGLNGRSVTAVMNWYEPSGGVPVQPYEPIMRASYQDYLWIDACMANLGYSGGTFNRLDAFNHDMRGLYAADHAISAFVAYNPPSAGAPSQMTDGKIGYAYLGGPYTQLLYRANGWSTSQVNRVYGHEVGHLFHAFDEYTASGTGNCSRAFNGRLNANYQAGTCNGTASCVMIDNSFSGSGATRQWNLCSHSPYHLGWTGMVPTPAPTSPISNAVVSVNPVVLHWTRNAPPTTVYSYVKITDHNSSALVYCGYQGELDTLALPLVNGQYDWVVSQGNANDYNGYAGVIGATGQFTVNAPLNAFFTMGLGNICAGGSVAYTDVSTGAPTTWTWSFPGGTPSTWSGRFPPAIAYNAPGSFDVTLTVGDGLGTHAFTRTAAVVVTGGMALPFTEQFESGIFPPVGWTSQGGEGGVGGGQGGLTWLADATNSCAQGTSAYVNAFSFTGSFAAPMLTTPRLSLILVPDPYLSFRWSYAQESATTTETLRVFGHDCAGSIWIQPVQLSGAQLATNDGALQPSPAWVPVNCEHWKTRTVSLSQLQGKTVQVDFRLDTQGGQNLFLDDVRVFTGSRVQLRVMLEGPFQSGPGTMNDALRVQALIPLAEPFTAAGYAFSGEGGGEATLDAVLAVTGNDAIADWVVVEVRDAVDSTHVMVARAALVQRDGDVVDIDGVSAVRVGVPAGSYYLAVRHRNHLGVMTAAPVAVSQTTSLIDLSLPTTPAWGVDARKLVGGRALLWAGDVNSDGTIKYVNLGNDREPILTAIGGVIPTNTVTGYRKEDVNMDGVVKYTNAGSDRDPILQNIGGTVPTNTRSQQLP